MLLTFYTYLRSFGNKWIILNKLYFAAVDFEVKGDSWKEEIKKGRKMVPIQKE